MIPLEPHCSREGLEDIACTDVTKNGKMSVAANKQGLEVQINVKQQGLFYGQMGRKNHEKEELCEKEGRINKQSAASMEEIDFSEMFDRILLCEEDPESFTDGKTLNAAVINLSPVLHTQGFSGLKNRTKKDKNYEDKEYLRNLLILCAQAISTDDNRNASDLLKKIRLHSSPVGNACQRLAHVFANGLDARLSGTAVENLFTYLTRKSLPTSEILENFPTHYKACPFNKITISFADNMSLKVAKPGKTIHIVDFGILLGFQWPLLILLLSRRPGGSPKLRLTGIELPQHGFKPEEKVVEAGRHLAKYCERFGIPFEYNAIVSQHWETIKIKELKISRNEVLIINCRHQNLLDETVIVNNPRDVILKLVREMRPDIFTPSVVNGIFRLSFVCPTVSTSALPLLCLYNMFDCNVPRDDIN